MISFELFLVAASLFTPDFLVAAFLPLSQWQRHASTTATTTTAVFLEKTSSDFRLAHRLDGLDKPTVWHEFTPLANLNNAINLGQGFPDWDPPEFALEAMRQSISVAPTEGGRRANQYTRSAAHLPLAQVLAQEYSERFQRDINPETQIATAVGCTNALYCVMQGLLNPGDEVLLLEPAFDIYTAAVQMAAGVPVYCPLRPQSDNENSMQSASQHFTLDLDELDSHLSPKTKLLLLNTPHNPTGKIFSREELMGISKLLHDKYPHVIVISDEVYEHIVFDNDKEPHISPATIPGMWDRTLTLSSAGKTFSCTGWKVGWAVGPAPLVQALMAVQQWVNFSSPTPNQDAIAQCLQQAKLPYQGFDSYYQYLAEDYHGKRDLLVTALRAGGMTPIVPGGGFFIMADTSNLSDDMWVHDFPNEITAAMPANPMPRDWALSRWMTRKVGVTAIPPSAFYSHTNVALAQNLLRFAYCKSNDTLLEAQKRFETYFQK